MDNLKKIFKYSSDNVIITDYDFNILWTNNEEGLFSSCGDNCSVFFKKESVPYKSGTYYVNQGGLLYQCKILNYPDCQNGVYVIQTSGEDVMYSAVKCQGVREVFINQSGAVRSAVTGITSSADMLKKALEVAEMDEEKKYIDITFGNCCKLLNISAGVLELIRYADGMLKKIPINLSAALEEFVIKSTNVLKGKISIEKQIEPKLYTAVDPERFTSFMASVVLLARSGNVRNNIIKISAEKKEDFISITVSSDRNGIDNLGQKFTRHIDMYEGDEVNINLFVAKRFCKAFDAKFLVLDDSKSSAFNVRLPSLDCLDKIPIVLESLKTRYDEGIYSKYHIIYSEILY